jgi:hypothetical protein
MCIIMIIPRSLIEMKLRGIVASESTLTHPPRLLQALANAVRSNRENRNSPFDGRLKQPYQSALVGPIPLLSVSSGHNFNTSLVHVWCCVLDSKQWVSVPWKGISLMWKHIKCALEQYLYTTRVEKYSAMQNAGNVWKMEIGEFNTRGGLAPNGANPTWKPQRGRKRKSHCNVKFL